MSELAVGDVVRRHSDDSGTEGTIEGFDHGKPGWGDERAHWARRAVVRWEKPLRTGGKQKPHTTRVACNRLTLVRKAVSDAS